MVVVQVWRSLRRTTSVRTFAGPECARAVRASPVADGEDGHPRGAAGAPGPSIADRTAFGDVTDLDDRGLEREDRTEIRALHLVAGMEAVEGEAGADGSLPAARMGEDGRAVGGVH